jgi:hypothetical protein
MGFKTKFLAQIGVKILVSMRGVASNGARLQRIAGKRY